MIAALTRTTVRLSSYRRLFVTDILLLLACTFLIAATILLYQISTRLYHQSVTSLVLMSPVAMEAAVVWFLNMVFALISLTWGVILAIKF